MASVRSVLLKFSTYWVGRLESSEVSVDGSTQFICFAGWNLFKEVEIFNFSQVDFSADSIFECSVFHKCSFFRL